MEGHTCLPSLSTSPLADCGLRIRPRHLARSWQKRLQDTTTMSLNIDPRRYHACCCVQGNTSLSTHMMVRVYDTGSAHRQKLANVLVDVHGFTMGNGREIPLFKVSALKEALRRQQEAYQGLIIFAY